MISRSDFCSRAQQVVKVNQAGGDAIDVIGTPGEFINAFIIIADDFLDRDQVPFDASLADIEKGFFGLIHHSIDGLILAVSQLGDLVGGFQHPAPDRVLFNDAPIGFSVKRVGCAIDQGDQIGLGRRFRPVGPGWRESP